MYCRILFSHKPILSIILNYTIDILIQFQKIHYSFMDDRLHSACPAEHDILFYPLPCVLGVFVRISYPNYMITLVNEATFASAQKPCVSPRYPGLGTGPVTA